MRTPNTTFLVQDIQPSMENLQKASNTTKTKEDERGYAYDAIVYCDGWLDNEIQNVFEACKKFDRESGSAPILTAVFPDGRFSDIKEAPLMLEPGYARQLLETVKSLGPAHPLAPTTVPLESKITASDFAIAAYETIKDEHALLVVQEEIAQQKLRDQYHLNYLHAQEKLGKLNAELLFPAVSK
jgi:hypothetical protein